MAALGTANTTAWLTFRKSVEEDYKQRVENARQQRFNEAVLFGMHFLIYGVGNYHIRRGASSHAVRIVLHASFSCLGDSAAFNFNFLLSTCRQLLLQ